MGDKKKSLDVLGLAPYGEAINTLARGLVEGAGAFLGRILLPAAEEFGLYLRDGVAAWRGKNSVSILGKAERMLDGHPSDNLHAHPRLVMRVLESGSWTDDDSLQEMWAGLLASSCSIDGRDESNLIFINLLSQLTSSEVRVLNFACKTATARLTPAGWLDTDVNMRRVEELGEVSGQSDFHRMDRELDHLRSLGLLSVDSGFKGEAEQKIANVCPSTLGLQLFALSHGHRGPPEEFFGLARP